MKLKQDSQKLEGGSPSEPEVSCIVLPARHTWQQAPASSAPHLCGSRDVHGPLPIVVFGAKSPRNLLGLGEYERRRWSTVQGNNHLGEYSSDVQVSIMLLSVAVLIQLTCT